MRKVAKADKVDEKAAGESVERRRTDIDPPKKKLMTTKKPKKLSSLRGSVKQDKTAEETALVMASDPNWQSQVLICSRKSKPSRRW